MRDSFWISCADFAGQPNLVAMTLFRYKYALLIGHHPQDHPKDLRLLQLNSYCSLLRDDFEESKIHLVRDEMEALQKPIFVDFDVDDSV